MISNAVYSVSAVIIVGRWSVIFVHVTICVASGDGDATSKSVSSGEQEVTDDRRH